MKKLRRLLTYVLTAAMLISVASPVYAYTDGMTFAAQETRSGDVDLQVEETGEAGTNETGEVTGEEDPAADEPAADEPASDEPAADEPEADEPEADEPEADEPEADEPEADEPVADEPAADEPAADEPVADEPAADEPEEDDPAAILPSVDEPVPGVTEANDPEAVESKTELTLIGEDEQEDDAEDKNTKMTLTLHANGGLFPKDVGYGSEMTLSADRKTLTIKIDTDYHGYGLSSTFYPQMAGRAILGWSETKNGMIVYPASLNFSEDDLTKDRTLYASWKESVSVKFKTMGGVFPEHASRKGKLATNKKLLTLNAAIGGTVDFSSDERPTKEGYEFEGWTTVKGGGLEYGRYADIPIYEKDTVFYAVWAKYVKVKLHANGGKFPEDAKYFAELSSDMKTLTVKVGNGDKVEIYSGYLPVNGKKKLTGWSTKASAKVPDEETSPSVEKRVYKDCDYYAVWNDDYCTATFSSSKFFFRDDTGKYVRKLKVKAIKGSRLSSFTPEVFEKNGNIYNSISSYLRWSDKKDAKIANSFEGSDYCLTKDATLYPIMGDVAITWDANGGKIGGKNRGQIDYEYGSMIASPDYLCVREGYSFAGWAENKKATVAQCISFHHVFARAPKTYYAVWNKNAYKITVDANGGIFTSVDGGTLSADRKSFTVYIVKGGSIGDLSFEVRKNGVALYNVGLATSKKGKALESLYYYHPKKDLKLYVVETRKKLPITFSANSGLFYNGTRTDVEYYDKGDTLIYYPTVNKTGWVLDGFYTKKKGGKKIEFGKTKVTGPTTFYAQWKKGVTLTFDANGGTIFGAGNRTKLVDTYEKGKTLTTLYNDSTYPIAVSRSNKKGFRGWSLKKNGDPADLAKIKLTKNTTLYAVWEKGDNLADGNVELAGKVYKYTGKPIKPKFTVYDREGKKVSSSEYTVRYSDNITAGTGYLTVIGKGSRSGMIRVPFAIEFRKTSKVTSVTGNSSRLKVKYTKAAGAKSYHVFVVNRHTGENFCSISTKQSATFTKLPKGDYLIYVLPAAEYRSAKASGTSITARAGNVVSKAVR